MAARRRQRHIRSARHPAARLAARQQSRQCGGAAGRSAASRLAGMRHQPGNRRRIRLRGGIWRVNQSGASAPYIARIEKQAALPLALRQPLAAATAGGKTAASAASRLLKRRQRHGGHAWLKNINSRYVACCGARCWPAAAAAAAASHARLYWRRRKIGNPAARGGCHLGSSTAGGSGKALAGEGNHGGEARRTAGCAKIALGSA